MSFNISLYKRMGVEMDELLTKHERAVYRKTDEHLIIEIITKTGEECMFFLNKTYPFHSPTITVNNKTYQEFMQIQTEYIPIMKELYGTTCFCCSSIICKDNWTPSKKVWELVDEVNNISRIKKKLMQTYYCRIICNKFLTHDIPLEKYL